MPRGENFKGRKPPGSGRKKGVPNRVTRTLKQKASEYGDDALSVLVSVMQDPTEPSDVRIRAAREVLDRGFGRPTIYVEAEIDNSRLIPWEELDRISQKALEEAEKKHREIVEGRAERLGITLDYTSEDSND
jgi:hypothetical protein